MAFPAEGWSGWKAEDSEGARLGWRSQEIPEKGSSNHTPVLKGEGVHVRSEKLQMD